jgi:hypothetical protein
MFPSETVREKRDGKVDQQDKCKQYSDELKAGYQEADVADRAGQKMNGRQHKAPSYGAVHESRIYQPRRCC